jgi:hypothetical protein
MNLPTPNTGLGETVDALIEERHRLENDRREAWAAVEIAEAAHASAVRADRDAYAKALRTPGGENPGAARTVAAKAAEQNAKDKLGALREAETHNTRDLVAALDADNDDITERLETAAEEARGTAISALETLSKALAQVGAVAALREWRSAPLKGENLRPFAPRPLHLNIGNLQRAPSQNVPAESLLELVGRVLESRTQFTDRELVGAARECGLAVSNIRRVDTGSAKWGSPPMTTQDIAQMGISKLLFTRGGLQVSVLVARESLDNMPLTNVVREVAAAVAGKFEGQVKGQIVYDDEATRSILASQRTDLSQRHEVEPSLTVAERAHRREKAEARERSRVPV